MATSQQQINITYATFKSVRASLPSYYLQYDIGEGYLLVAVSDAFVYLCRLTKDSEIADFEATFKSAISVVGSKKDAIALASIIAKRNKVQPKAEDGKDIVTMWPTEGAKVTFMTPNWCDRTTWYYRAVRVVDEVATVDQPGVYTVYKVTHTNLIDTYHGKLTGEDYLKDAQGNSYRVLVKVNSVTKTEQDPHTASGGDYTINYATGRITFLSALTVNDEVKVTYHYENGSEWVLKPDSGKKLQVRKVEVQFSEDIGLTDTVIFQPYGPVEIWAPSLTPTPYPAGTMLPLGDADVMKTFMDYVNDANGAFPTIPKMGGAGWRGMAQPVQLFQWDYQSVTELASSKGVEIRIKLQHDTPFNGWTAVATFYCLSVSE